jgi:sugar lactone lactonase YvrE
MSAALRIAFALVCGIALSLSAQQGRYEELLKEASAARQAQDAPRLLGALERLNTLRPKHPTILVNLVAAYAMNGRHDDAIAVAERLLAMKVYFDVARADFDPLRGDPRFVRIADALHALQHERVAGAKVAFRIAQKGLIPEGLAWDAANGRFLVSSVRLGKIIQVDRRHRASEFVKSGSPGIHALSGLGIDSHRHLLWACSTASPRFGPYKKGDSNDPAIVAFDLNDGKVARRIPFEKADGFCDDLTVANDGTVYVSDSTGAVLTLSPGRDHLRVLVPNGAIRSPQGSVLSANGRYLYVADYGGPIRAVDLQTGDVTPLRLPDDFQPMGIDGITRHRNRLIAVQNGIEPNRIVALTLSADGLSVIGWKILEMNHPLIDEPTIGKVVGDTYYFVGASQGNKFDTGNPDPAKLTDAIVFRIRLR